MAQHLVPGLCCRDLSNINEYCNESLDLRIRGSSLSLFAQSDSPSPDGKIAAELDAELFIVTKSRLSEDFQNDAL